MSVTATSGASQAREIRPSSEPGPSQTPVRREANRESNSRTPGGGPPDDFGPGGGRSPDYNHDGTISDAESRTYDADTRAASRQAGLDSRERIAHEREEGKNYRADVSAATAQNASNNDNKMHKMFGKQSAPVPMPQRPSTPEA
jgi:hypothetical protein